MNWFFLWGPSTWRAKSLPTSHLASTSLVPDGGPPRPRGLLQASLSSQHKEVNVRFLLINWEPSWVGASETLFLSTCVRRFGVCLCVVFRSVCVLALVQISIQTRTRATHCHDIVIPWRLNWSTCQCTWTFGSTVSSDVTSRGLTCLPNRQISDTKEQSDAKFCLLENWNREFGLGSPGWYFHHTL